MNDSFLSMGGLSLDRLQAFLRVAGQGSMVRAAGGDPSRQSLISRQVADLEKFFGVELVRRRGRGIELTEAGKELARRTRLHLAALHDFRATAGRGEVEVRIAAGNSVVEWWLIPRLAAVRAQHPRMRFVLVSLRTNDAVQGLVDHRLEGAVVRSNAVVRPLKSAAIGAFGYRLFVPRALRNKEMSDLPLVLTLGGEFEERFMRAAAGWKRSPHIAFRCASFTQSAELARNGLCAAVLPEVARERLGPGFDERPVPGLAGYRRELALAWHPRLLEIRPDLARVLTTLRAAAD